MRNYHDNQDATVTTTLTVKQVAAITGSGEPVSQWVRAAVEQRLAREMSLTEKRAHMQATLAAAMAEIVATEPPKPVDDNPSGTL
jgi:hypothetical protein